MTVFIREMPQVIRRLFRYPVFTLIAIGTLAMGIGANTAIFSLVNGILLKPLPFDEPDELVGVWHTAPGLGFEEVNQSPALHFTYLDEGRTFSEVGMWNWNTASVTGLDEPEEVQHHGGDGGDLPGPPCRSHSRAAVQPRGRHPRVTPHHHLES